MPPFARVDHLVIAVRELDASAAAYAAMLGVAPSWRGRHPAYGTANVLFGLGNCYLELLAVDGPSDHPLAVALGSYLVGRPEGLFAIALGSDDLVSTVATLKQAGLSPSPPLAGEGTDDSGRIRRWQNVMLDRGETRGVSVFAIQHDDVAAIAPAAAPTADRSSVVHDVDHVVLFSDDLAGALALWRDTFGVPERWRREFPERGTVNVGLRLGGVTLELVAPLTGTTGTRGERPWGLAYDVDDVDAAVARLRASGIPASAARTGLGPGTRVCTVKWTDRLPTLLIQHDGRNRQV